LRLCLFSLTIFVFVSTTCFCQEKELIELRSYFKNTKGVHEIKKIINISKKKMDDPVVLAYNYTGKLMLLDYSNNPFEKYKVFKTKTKQIDSIISVNQKNIEIRLLRYVLQKNSPNFLKYNTNLSSDLKFIKSHLYKENENLKLYIKSLLKQFNNERSRDPS